MVCQTGYFVSSFSVLRQIKLENFVKNVLGQNRLQRKPICSVSFRSNRYFSRNSTSTALSLAGSQWVQGGPTSPQEVPQVPRRSHRYPGVCPTSLGGPSTALRKLTAVSEFLPSAECVRGGGGGVSPSVGAGVNAGRRQRRPAPLPARPFRTQGARNTVVFNSPGNNHNLSIFWPRS